MRRLRFYRVLLPAILVVFIVILVRQLKPLEGAHSVGAASGEPIAPKVVGVRAVDLEGSRKKYAIDAGLVEETEPGRIELEDVNKLEIFREEMLPLIVRALSGHIEGEEGGRVFTFDEEVTLEDPERGLTVRIPALEVDEADAVARSTDRVLLEGADVRGTAEGLLYGLEDQPTELTSLALEDGEGGSLSADKAILHDGLDDVELIDRVRIQRDEEFLHADHLRSHRWPNGETERIIATGGVRARALAAASSLVTLRGDTLELKFDEEGVPRVFELIGDADVHTLTERVSAAAIRARRSTSANPFWEVRAEGSALVRGMFNFQPALLRAETVVARTTLEFELIGAQATGRVRFDAPETRAESSHATFDALRTGVIRLLGSERRKARLARFQTRIAAEDILTDTTGTKLEARRNVEATLLPGDGDAPQVSTSGLFEDDEAVHFVSAQLEGAERGQRLTFTGGVRGWQGDRTLSAETVTVDQTTRTLHAEENVATRMPRDTEGGAAGESDYIQVSSDTLDYSEDERIAVFRDAVRVRIVEGWLEAQQLEVAMLEGESQVEEMRATGEVRLEFREPQDEPGMAPKLVSGTADRAIYRPAERTVWLIGDQAPASVRRIGLAEGTTTGRVLRYQLDEGTLEVDSGESGPARIRTSGRPG